MAASREDHRRSLCEKQAGAVQARETDPGTAIDCADVIRRSSAEAGADLVQLFERFVFAYRVGNGDLHQKNLSLLADEVGRHLLSPIYDQVCTALYPGLDSRLGLPGGHAPGRLIERGQVTSEAVANRPGSRVAGGVPGTREGQGRAATIPSVSEASPTARM